MAKSKVLRKKKTRVLVVKKKKVKATNINVNKVLFNGEH